MNDQVTREETVEILRLANQALAAEGDYVELGCYRGDTSVLLGQLLQKQAKMAPQITSPAPLRVEPVKNCTSSCGKTVENQLNACGKTVHNLVKTVQKTDQTVENNRLPCGNSVNNLQQYFRHLWIYDSFAGLPKKTREDASGAGANFQAGELLVTKREVVDKIRKHGLKNVIIKKAWFDDLNDKDLPARIAFAFCDGDLYGSIKTSLRLVYPRLAEQGIIIVHDYNNPELPGSARAVDEFLRARPEFKLQVRHTLAILTKR